MTSNERRNSTDECWENNEQNNEEALRSIETTRKLIRTIRER